MADTLPGSLKLGANISIGASSFTVSTEAHPLTKLARWVCVDPFTTQAEIRRVVSHSGATITVAGTFAYNHSSNDPVLWLSSGVWDVSLFGAIGDNSTDDTAALQAAIDDAQRNTPAGMVVLGPAIYKITSTLTISTNGVSLVGAGFGGGLFKSYIYAYGCTTALLIDKGGASITYQVMVRGIDFHGQSTSTTGIKIVNGYECKLEDVLIVSFTGTMLYGDNACGLICNTVLLNGASLGSNVGFLAIGGANNWMRNCHFYALATAIQVSGTVFDLNISDCFFETWDTALKVDSTSSHCDIYGLHFARCYFLSTNGGGSYAARPILAYAPNNTYHNVVRNLVLESCYFYTTASKYMIEVSWNTYLGGGSNRFWAALRDCYMHASTNITSWLHSDVTDTTYTFVRVERSGVVSYNDVVWTDDATKLTGGLHKFTANDTTPSVAADAPYYRTANTAPTTITMFDNGYPGQRIIVLIDDAFTTFDFTGTNLVGNGAADWAASNLDWLDAIFDGTRWRCAVHDCS